MRPILVSVCSLSVICALNLDDRLYLAPSVRFSPDDKHKQLLETVIEFGLNRYLMTNIIPVHSIVPRSSLDK